jgi:hypothetical protein
MLFATSAGMLCDLKNGSFPWSPVLMDHEMGADGDAQKGHTNWRDAVKHFSATGGVSGVKQSG